MNRWFRYNVKIEFLGNSFRFPDNRLSWETIKYILLWNTLPEKRCFSFILIETERGRLNNMIQFPEWFRYCCKNHISEIKTSNNPVKSQDNYCNECVEYLKLICSTNKDNNTCRSAPTSPEDGTLVFFTCQLFQRLPLCWREFVFFSNFNIILFSWLVQCKFDKV